MTEWKNLRLNPPCKDCNICVRIGSNFETYKFVRHSDVGWDIIKHIRPIDHGDIPANAMYINLDTIN